MKTKKSLPSGQSQYRNASQRVAILEREAYLCFYVGECPMFQKYY
jgi:hypothetical protein